MARRNTTLLVAMVGIAIACGEGNEATSMVSAPATATGPNRLPIGWVDNASDLSGSSIVRPADKVRAIGWAGDWEDGTKPTSVTISVDGRVAGTTTASTLRPDVAAYFANPAFANTGWSLALDTSG